MPDLIRREDALRFQDELEPVMCFSDRQTFSATKDSDLVAYIQAIPAVDAVEVKHGTWELIEDESYAECSKCGCCVPIAWSDDDVFWNFCPNCGARMDGRREDGDA